MSLKKILSTSFSFKCLDRWLLHDSCVLAVKIIDAIESAEGESNLQKKAAQDQVTGAFGAFFEEYFKTETPRLQIPPAMDRIMGSPQFL